MRLLAIVTLAILLGPSIAWAAPPSPPGAPVTIGRAEQFDFKSAITGRDYRIYISRPLIPGPQSGYPVVYVFDGNGVFGTATEAARLLSAGGEARAAVIVGIGYPTESMPQVMTLRMKDMTTPTTAERLASSRPSPGETIANTGGLDDYLRVVEQEIKPLVARHVRVDPADQTLMGHSLGGLAVLRALFTEPTAFRTFVASSPSIWWNGRSILEGEAAFVGKVERQEIQPRIFIDVGGLEQTARSALPGLTFAESQLEAQKFRMVDNAAELGARLAAVKGGPRYQVTTHVFPDETHMSVMWAATSRALRFALDPTAK
jgi:uncharacterized protein